MIKEINSNEFEQLVKDNKLTVSLIGTPWCASCNEIKPQFRSMAEHLPDVNLYEMNADENADFVFAMGIRSIPVFAFYKNGEQLHIGKGMNHITLRNKINELK